MGCTVAELLERIDSRELTEWMAYARLEPFGPLAVNLNAGKFLSTYINCHLGKDAKQVSAEDVALGDFRTEEITEGEEEGHVQTLEEQKQMVLAIARAFGAKDNRKSVSPKR